MPIGEINSDWSDRSAAVQNNEELFALAQEMGRLGLFEWLVQDGIVRLSPNLMSLYGLTNFDGQYETWLARVFREDVLRLTDLRDRTFAAQDREFQIEFRIVREPNSVLRWMEARHLCFYDQHGSPLRVVGVNADITEKKRALLQLHSFTEALEDRVRDRTRQLEAENEARLKAEESLRRAQKMEAVGQLTGGIAHDFNNLLTVILGGLETIARQLPHLPPSPATSRIARARDLALAGAQRAVTVTNRLLAFSRQQPLAPKPINVNRLVSFMGDFLKHSLNETISLETALSAGIWQTHADASQLENAILNLALNARDAMPNGGKLTIETSNCYLDESYVSGLEEPVTPGQYVMVAVADTGTGMDKTTIGRVFEPFFTTKEVGKGTGLGLSQIYGFVRQSSGHVKIYSELGQGTTVKIYLPRYIGPEENPIHELELRDRKTAMGAETILVVEDDDALRRYTVDILQELGYRTLAAATPAIALKVIDSGVEIDLLLSDVVMPEMNGRQLAEEAVRRRPDLKVLFTTGYTRNAIVHHGRLDPGVELITKPYTFNELAARIRTVLESAKSL
jgi:signal transduction histidine kinase/ActR/RegA family two-component response regulator